MMKVEINRLFATLDSEAGYVAMNEIAGHARMYADLAYGDVPTHNELYARYRDGDAGAFETLRNRLIGRLTRQYGPAAAERALAKLATVADRFDPAQNDVLGWAKWLSAQQVR